MTINNSASFESRLSVYKKSIKPQVFGKQWERDKKNFKVDIQNGEFQNFGKWNFFPGIYNEKINSDDLFDLNINKKNRPSEKKVFFEIHKTKLCLPKNQGNKTLLYAINYYDIIKDYISEGDIVCDVGSGSGLLASIINYKKKTTNILIDIPEVLFVSIGLIFTIFPEKKILLPNEFNEKIEINNYDFVFLQPNQTKYLQNKSINFGINTQSFMEMDFEEVDNYLIFFNETIKNNGYFFCSNRLRKRHYFFNYNFYFLKKFEKIFLRKDKIAYSKKNQASLLNILLKRDDDLKNNNKKFSLISKIFGLFLFKPSEFLYWIKKDLKNYINKFNFL